MTDPLASLDDAQRRAAEALRGPVRILAGAGTGKTRAITHRIAHGVASGVFPPDKVLALTFTTRAAGQLRARLSSLGVRGVQARTFHSAALSQLSYFWPTAVGGGLPDVVDGKARLLAQAAQRARLSIDTATLRDLAGEIEWRKVGMLTIEQYVHAGRPAPPGFSPHGVAEVMRAYEELKDERRQLDFEDVLSVTVGMLRAEPWARQQVHERYRFFVVDEYQDVSPLQQALLELWLGGRDDVCVVGDASQTIFSFTGATSRFLLDFPRAHPNAVLVELDDNHRSAPAVLEAANRTMAGEPGAVRLRAVDPDAPGEVSVHAHSDERAEAAAVAAAIREDIASGIAPTEIAVLYRTVGQAALIEAALTDADVRHQVRGSVPFFELPEVKQALPLIRASALAASSDPAHKVVADVLRGLGWSEQPPQAAGAVRNRWDALDALMRLLDSSPPGTTARDFSAQLERRRDEMDAPVIDAVTLATLHAAKGLEWESVHVVGVAEGLLPISYARTDQAIAEERRLLYVGITRARRRLRLHWSAGSAGSGGRARSRSRFLDAIEPRPRR